MPAQRLNLAAGTSRGVLLDLIRSHAPISRVDLAERTGLTQPTISAAVRGLIDDGLVVTVGQGASTGGKPPTLLAVNSRARFAIGLELGRESNHVAVVDVDGDVVGRTHLPGADGAAVGEAGARLAGDLAELLTVLGISRDAVIGVGVVAPGPLDVERGMLLSAPQGAGWSAVPVRRTLSELFDLPVLLDNDATAAAVGDFWVGALDDTHAHATIYMGTGIGSGVLIDGTVMRGASSNSGELGQLLMLDAGGSTQTLQSLAAPPAIVARARRQPELIDRYRLDEADDFRAYGHLAAGAARGDADAAALIRESARYVAIGAVDLANLFDLDSISLAGPGFEVAGAEYVNAIMGEIDRSFFARDRHPVRVQMSPQVAEAAAVGGAALVLQTFLAPRAMGLSR